MQLGGIRICASRRTILRTRCLLLLQKRPFAAQQRNDALCHVWTAPAVENRTSQRSVRVQPCIPAERRRFGVPGADVRSSLASGRDSALLNENAVSVTMALKAPGG